LGKWIVFIHIEIQHKEVIIDLFDLPNPPYEIRPYLPLNPLHEVIGLLSGSIYQDSRFIFVDTVLIVKKKS